MNNGDLNWITNFIWGIADDALRDLYVRGKYRDVILPMMVLRRLDAVLEPTKSAVLSMKDNLDKAGITNQDAALRQAAGQAFYNTSRFNLRDLRNRASQAQLKADFEAFLDGFSPNVQEILDNFEFRNQLPKLSKADVLGTLIEKFLDSSINLGPKPVLNGDGSVKHPGLDNHAMGTIFEELVRRFNEANNEEAGEHWTPRDAVKLMAKLIFVPIADQIQSGTYLLYDGACGTGGMLTVAEETLNELAEQYGKQVSTHLFGQEINGETYAIAKADLLLKGEGEEADNIVGGPEWSTLANDAFPSKEFDFMLSNPPYGKSWKSDQERMGGKSGMRDPRFVIEHAGDAEYSLVTRSSDGQLLFLANMLSKMKHNTPLGSRIADATAWFRPLRKNLGKKNCELADADIERILQAFIAFEETEQSRIFDNAEFGYSRITVERPLRARGIDAARAHAPKEIKALKDEGRIAEDGAPVIRRIHKQGKVEADPLRGLFPLAIDGKRCVVEYEPDSELRDTETVPLKEPGGIEAFIRREVLPHAPDAWIDEAKTTIGYEVSFTRYFYKPQPLRPLEAIRADILALERETDGLMADIIGAAR